MTRKQAVTRMENVQARMEILGGKHRMSRNESAEFDELRSEFDDLAAHVETLDSQTRADIREGARTGRYRAEGEGRDLPGYGPCTTTTRGPVDGQRDAALRTLDRHVSAGSIPAAGAEVVESLVTTGPTRSRSWAARWAAEAGSEDYRSAFAKRALDPEHGHLQWTQPEAAAWRTVTALQSERAMSLTDNAGGFLAPLELDATILLSNAGTNVPILQVCRVIQTVSDVWSGVTSAGTSAEWLAEASEAADASPVLAQPSIPAYKMSCFTPYSVELEGDAVSLLEQLGVVLRDAAEQLLATALTTGSGSGQPTGIVTALAASAGGASIVAGTGSEALAAADIYKVQNELGARWQANAAWMASLTVLNVLRQFETGSGAHAFPGLHMTPASLLGRPVFENSVMDSTINAAATEANYVAIYGDWSQYCATVRVGSQVELVPHLVGSNRRPNGQRGAWLWGRYGADSLIDGAFKMLNVATTA